MLLCSLGEEGATAIAEFVKQGKKLKELNLYMNDIGTGGAYKVLVLYPLCLPPHHVVCCCRLIPLSLLTAQVLSLHSYF